MAIEIICIYCGVITQALKKNLGNLSASEEDPNFETGKSAGQKLRAQAAEKKRKKKRRQKEARLAKKREIKIPNESLAARRRVGV